MTNSSVKVIAVAGGKGGVGKTQTSVNLSIALAKQGKRVMLLDADLGLANIDILLGLKAERNLSHVLKGECKLSEVIVEAPSGLKIIPASSGIKEMTELRPEQHAGIIQSFSELNDELDYLIVDTAAGLSDMVVSFIRATHETIVVVCNEPMSVTDAYALIKVLSREYNMNHFRILSNMVRSEQEGKELFEKLSAVTDRFLDVSSSYFGSIPLDEHVLKAARCQQAVTEAYPKSISAKAYTRLAGDITRWADKADVTGNIQFFIERLLSSQQESQGIVS